MTRERPGVEEGGIAFPSRVTHVHWVTPVIAGARYAMTCWLSEPNARPDDAIAA